MPEKILEMIYFIPVRRVEDQIMASRKVRSESVFSSCRLLIVDDATTNFVIDFGKEVAERQTILSAYLRELALLAHTRGMSVLLTNSARFKGEKGEAETTGDLLSEFSLYRMHFSRIERRRFATLMQPKLTKPRVEFDIDSRGIS
jgi:RecA/RadA recombinase